MSPTIRADPSARTLTTDAGKLRVRSVVTTIDADRAGDVVIPTGVKNLDEFLLNPVVLWAHNRTHFPPIGICEWIDVQPRRLVAQTKFAEGVPFAEDIFRLYEQNVLRGWSIGFVPRRAAPRGRGVTIAEWDLLEYSAVPIPENPGALTVALQKGLVRDVGLKHWLGLLGDDPGGKWWRTTPSKDVLSELFA
jgi:hypothetical protein